MFEFKFNENANITKEFILKNLSEEEIFCYYLGIDRVSKKLICSRLRSDKNPTCGFYRNSKGDLYLHDFATGEFYNCFSLSSLPDISKWNTNNNSFKFYVLQMHIININC